MHEASEDIRVFKVMAYINGQISSLYQGFDYTIGNTYNEELGQINQPEPTFSLRIVHRGFHSYDANEVQTTKVQMECYNGIRISTREYDKTLDLLRISETRQTLIKVDCTIPKGSRYFLNEEGEYVSDSIRIDDITGKFYYND